MRVQEPAGSDGDFVIVEEEQGPDWKMRRIAMNEEGEVVARLEPA